MLEKGTLLSLWKLPSCSIGTDISNHGEEQLHMLKSGRSGMSLTLQGSSAWSADTQKPMKQSRVNFCNWQHFLRKLLEPSRTFFSRLVLQSSPCLLEHFRCSSEMCRSKGDSLHGCDRSSYSSNATESEGGSPQTSVLLVQFCLLRVLLLYYKSSRGRSFCQLQKECKSCTVMYCTMYCTRELLGFCSGWFGLVLFSYPVK